MTFRLSITNKEKIKIKQFIFGFCWMLSCQIITSDLGVTTE
jgi:hypothetical protein